MNEVTTGQGWKTVTLPKPALKTKPGSVVTKETQVTMSCEGISGAREYFLYKEGIPEPWQRQTPLHPGNKTQFLIPSIKWHHTGQYHCCYRTAADWSELSDPLELLATDDNSKPGLSVLPSPLMTSGDYVTLQCVSQQENSRFIPATEDQKFSRSLESQYIYTTGQYKAQLSVGPVTPSQRWIFKWYSYDSSNPQVWSGPSDPMELLVSVQLPVTPSLSVQPGPTVFSGENVSLLCQSRSQLDTFLLTKEGAASPPLHLNSRSQDGKYWAEFSMSAVTLALGGTYRCYSSQSSSPYLLSHPSDPMEHVVSGVSETINLSQNMSEPKTGSQSQDHIVENLIGMGMAGLVLVVLGILLFEAQHSQRRIQGGPR
ncbi:leukocyte immunoglobulin-like receptor subfamily A member 1 [Nannospalax galili]|uniref:leukocyte immunoglobulin-like receptor subfamily A member 1 n=1 Tax=Nannospalax galili TaxID=1026970 RepID=UPI00111C90FD|nr:leukocyte immunoglobulin-like receptor subfamily A member 1 [Nannospalax galili]